MINTICKVMKISRSAYFKYKREKRPIIALLEKYFDKEDLEEFLLTNKITKMERLKETTSSKVSDVKIAELSLALLEDHAHFSLVEKINYFYSTNDVADIFKTVPRKILIKIINEIREEAEFDQNNSKDLLLSGLMGYVTSIKKLEHTNHPKIIYDFISKKLSRIEVFLLINEPEKYFK